MQGWLAVCSAVFSRDAHGTLQATTRKRQKKRARSVSFSDADAAADADGDAAQGPAVRVRLDEELSATDDLVEPVGSGGGGAGGGAGAGVGAGTAAVVSSSQHGLTVTDLFHEVEAAVDPLYALYGHQAEAIDVGDSLGAAVLQPAVVASPARVASSVSASAAAAAAATVATLQSSSS